MIASKSDRAKSRVGVSGGADIALLFPPVTEARLFPYLSLPMITAYLRAHLLHVAQFDLNIELCRALATRNQIEAYLAARSDGGSLRERYRVAMASYVRDRCESLWEQVETRSVSPPGLSHAIRFLNHAVNLMLEDSGLSPPIHRLDEIDECVLRPHPALGQAARSLRTLVEGLLATERPRIIAISAPFFSQLVSSLLIARWVKEQAPDTIVALGGQQAMLWHDALGRLDTVRRYVDVIGTGKGEEALLQLHQHVARGAPASAVPDVVYVSREPATAPVRRSALRVRDLPAPDFVGLPVGHYLSAEPELAMITCIGCTWGRCVFCSYGNRSHRAGAYEQATPRQIATACQALVEKHQIRRINFVDENTNLRLVLAAMRLLNARGHEIRFSTRNRLEATLLDPDFCRELRARGCVLMSCGFETTSQRLLDRLDRGVHASMFQAIIDNLHEAGITLRLSLLGGIPDESEDEARISWEFLRANEHKIGIDIMQMLVAEPGTYLTDDPTSNGIALAEDGELRGNDLLNFGQGRMGLAFAYRDGPGFAERLRGFVNVYRTVRPQKNDDIAPERRTRVRQSREPIEQVHLHPWVWLSAAEKSCSGADLLVDLLWQRFIKLPPGVRHRTAPNGRLMIVASEQSADSATAQQLLAEIIRNDLGEANYASARA